MIHGGKLIGISLKLMNKMKLNHQMQKLSKLMNKNENYEAKVRNTKKIDISKNNKTKTTLTLLIQLRVKAKVL